VSAAFDWRPAQFRLRVKPDGVPGPVTYATLIRHMGGTTHADAIGLGCARYLEPYEIVTKLRLAHWLGQMAHESGGFRYLREIWGPTPAQARYEGRKNLGNTQPGDGRRFMGRGIIQLTGRDNYTKYAALTGLPLVENPGLAEVPETAVYIACLYWKRKGLNTLADADNGMQITRLINGGYNGIEDRAHRVAQAKAILA